MAPFSSDLVKFLSELAKHNDRDWFQANKTRYETSVRDPFLRFIGALGPRLKKISPQFVVNDAPNGGSMMRIYRDTRFSKDKRPYKTAVGANFWHKDSREGATPAFFLRLEPGNVGVGAGIWQPEPASLKKIRTAIVDDSKTWKAIRQNPKIGKLGGGCHMLGESLKRPPPGFDGGHPFIDDIKRKDFGISIALDDKRLTNDKFIDDVIGGFTTAAPFLAFLTKAVGMRF